MNKIRLDNQLNTARYNYNYFFMKMIIKLLQISLKLSFVLLFSSLFNYSIINIITIIYTIISIINIYAVITKYKPLIEDIGNTLNIEKLSFEIDLNVISNNLFKGFFYS